MTITASAPASTGRAGSPRLLDAPPADRLPRPGLDQLAATLEHAGLTGRGGGGFPTAVKLRALSARGRPVVVGNAMEGEPLSRKDATLLKVSPHLVTEGLALVAGALGTDRMLLATGPHVPTGPVAGPAAAYGVEVRPLPGGFVAGQESALVNALSGRAAVPSDPATRVTARGVDGRPTLVLNAETLARIALVVRHGPAAARGRLLTLSGAVAWPGVVETTDDLTLREVVELGRPDTAHRAVLVGGYHGTWMRPTDLGLAVGGLAHAGRLGAGVLHVLGGPTCPLRATAHVAGYLAEASTRQCGPCVNALPRVADSVRRLADLSEPSTPPDPRLPAEIERLARLADGRGACAHPDGTVRMVASALRVFADDVAAHLVGRCVAEARSLVRSDGVR